ncbi:MAG: nucleoside-diphosphate kinase [Hoeflea sp.]|uniref:nucleoside-diphosphate kinase n=1 Tax=Hoeflea sp. TaxID=1940281 RepID=UPI003EFA8D1A
MWKNQTCTLTTKDITILQTMYDRRHALPNAVRKLLRHKLDNAFVVFSDDIDVDVVTLNTRVRYRIGNGQPQTAIITQGQMDGMVGQCLSLSTVRGLGLLGLTEPTAISLPKPHNAAPDRLVVEAVLFQPEAARRARLQQETIEHSLRLVPDASLIP